MRSTLWTTLLGPGYLVLTQLPSVRKPPRADPQPLRLRAGRTRQAALFLRTGIFLIAGARKSTGGGSRFIPAKRSAPTGLR